MFVEDVNVKIYNLSAGKSLPEWLTDKKKRSKLLKKVDTRNQIELMQGFEMPDFATGIKITPDNEYIFATGTYKPRVKCYEFCNVSIKFERCFDSEVTAFDFLSEDYTKLAFLQNDRYIEIHSGGGRYFRFRIPRFGRDIKFDKNNGVLVVVGTGNEVYRFSTQLGSFLQSYEAEGTALNACEFNPEHGLLVTGSVEGVVESWDPRSNTKYGNLNVASALSETKVFPSITSLKFKDGLHMAVGTASGHVLLYDIRSKTPQVVKNHIESNAIKRLAFNTNNHAVYSMDSSRVNLWDEISGKQIAHIKAEKQFNDFATIDNYGLVFIAQEDVKMLTYYIPSMGPAPKWCSRIDALTEEIESNVVENIYEDYQFVTQKELEELGLENLVGTDLLRSSMHGHFMDSRLYNKAKTIVAPFSFDEFKKKKVKEIIKSERTPKLKVSDILPKINQDLALKLIDEKRNKVVSKNTSENLLDDGRFKAMFQDSDFEINKNAEEFKLLAPVLNRLEKSKLKEIKKQRIEVDLVNDLHKEENEYQGDKLDDDNDLFENSDDDGSEEDFKEFSKEMKAAHKQVKKNRTKDIEKLEVDEPASRPMVNFVKQSRNREEKLSLTARLAKEQAKFGKETANILGKTNKQMSFSTGRIDKQAKKRDFEMKKHSDERRKVARSIKGLKLKKANFK